MQCIQNALYSAKPALGKAWSRLADKRLFFTPSQDRLALARTLGYGTVVSNTEILTYTREDGNVFAATDCEVHGFQGQKLTSRTLLIGDYDIFAPFLDQGDPGVGVGK